MKRRYIRDMDDVLQKKEEDRVARTTPFYTSDLGQRQPVLVLTSLVELWPLHDLRYDTSSSSRYTSYDSDLMKDLAKGMQSRVLRKDLSTGILEIAVELQSNLSEYERYNIAVHDHNKSWIAAGCPETVFDPVHGDEHAVRDQLVDEAVISSKHYPQPRSIYSDKSGPISETRPEIKREAYILVRYCVALHNDQWELGYVVYDTNDQVIYYNQVHHKDLAYLVRRSVQEIWGNPEIRVDSGAFLEGIPMLIQGKKLPICKRDNSQPSLLGDGAILKEKNTGLRNANVKHSFYSTLASFTRSVMPVLLIIGSLVYLVYWLGWAFGPHGTTYENGYTIPEECWANFLLWTIIFVVSFLGSRHLSQQCSRKASEIDAARRFI